MKKRTGIIWGVFLVLLGAYLIVSRLGYVPIIQPFTIILTIACGAMVIFSIPKLNFVGILFPLAIIGILYAEELRITSLTPWTLLAVALLGSIGLSLIFSPLKKKRKRKKRASQSKYADASGVRGRHDFDDVEGEEVSGEEISLRATFGGVVRYVTSDNLKYVEIHATFSGVKMFFDRAEVKDGNVTVEVNSKFSGIQLYIPKNWKVINQVNTSFGSVEMKGSSEDTANVNLTLMGNVTFGAIEIYYI